MLQTKYDADGLNNLVIAVMEQAYIDASLTMPTVRFKPNNKAYNRESMKRLRERAKIISDAKDFIERTKEAFAN